MAKNNSLDFRIGEWWARCHLHELQRGKTRVRIEARSMDVLACLAQHAGRVVTKDQILAEVWGDAHVSEGVIAHAISELRRALKDSPKKPRYIQTAHRRGYRLVASVAFAQGEDEPRVDAVIGQGFRLTERLGQGAMGVVFRARDETLHRDVALKFLTPELSDDDVARRRFLREARLAARLDHPNLATVHEVGETPSGWLYIVTAFYGGGTLKQRLIAEGPLAVDEATCLIRQLAEGVAVAHRAGIVHRDLKPSNLLLAADGTLKVADFGIAKLQGSTRLTRTGATLGTPGYQSPEQSRGEEVDPRTDVWSLGVVLYEMLTSESPFRRDNDLAVLHAILEDDPPPLDTAVGTVPVGLEDLVRCTLAKDREDRFESVEAFLDALDALEGGEEPQPLPMSTPKSTPTRLWIGMGLAALVVVALVGGWFLPRDEMMTEEEKRIRRLIDIGIGMEEDGDSTEDLEEAIGRYEAALEIRDDHPLAMAHLALALGRHKNRLKYLPRICDLVNQVRSSYPDLWLAHQAEGKLLYLEGHYDLAETAARTALNFLPANARWADLPYTLLGFALYERRQIEQGIAAVQEGTEVGYGYIRGRLALAYLLGDQLAYDGAVTEYSRVLSVDPKNFDALNNRGRIYSLQGRSRDAVKDLKEALNIRQEAITLNNLGKVYFDLAYSGDEVYWDFALDTFEMVVALEPEYPTPHYGLGNTYRHGPWKDEASAMSSYGRALDLFEQKIDSGNANWRDKAHAALCQAELGRFEEAIQRIEGIPTASYEVDIFAAKIYALARERQKLYDRVEAALKESISRNFFANEPAFDPYQADPNYRRLIDGDPVP